ncbi:Gfo/Idh/MocA family oxidoreductase [Pelagibacterales bacterium SAG-MED02]|nr:Gfo/Idh/MocA family oxidoreductase [Pelagibacterales bacterium SAG-MED02]
MKTKINAAVLGLGVGERHVQTLKKNKLISKIYVFDLNSKKKNLIKKKYNVLAYKNKYEAFNDKEINLIVDATYDNFHYKNIINSIKSNKNIFVEKPAFQKKNDADKCFKLLKKKKLFIGTNYILRSSPRFKKIKKMIDNKSFGDIYYFEGDYNYGRLNKITSGWRGKIPFYSITLGGGSHIIDLSKFLINKKILEVKSYSNKIVTNKTNFKYADNVVSIVKFENQIVGKISSNFSCVYPHFHKINLYGSNLTFENGIDYGKLFTKRNKNKFRIIKQQYKPLNKGEILEKFINDLVLKKNRTFYINQIFDAMSVGFAIEKSIKENKTIKVKYYK